MTTTTTMKKKTHNSSFIWIMADLYGSLWYNHMQTYVSILRFSNCFLFLRLSFKRAIPVRAYEIAIWSIELPIGCVSWLIHLIFQLAETIWVVDCGFFAMTCNNVTIWFVICAKSFISFAHQKFYPRSRCLPFANILFILRRQIKIFQP